MSMKVRLSRALVSFMLPVWRQHAHPGLWAWHGCGKEVGYEGEVAGGDGGGVED